MIPLLTLLKSCWTVPLRLCLLSPSPPGTLQLSGHLPGSPFLFHKSLSRLFSRNNPQFFGLDLCSQSALLPQIAQQGSQVFSCPDCGLFLFFLHCLMVIFAVYSIIAMKLRYKNIPTKSGQAGIGKATVNQVQV